MNRGECKGGGVGAKKAGILTGTAGCLKGLAKMMGRLGCRIWLVQIFTGHGTQQ